jgi:hypothetical protein
LMIVPGCREQILPAICMVENMVGLSCLHFFSAMIRKSGSMRKV